MAALPYTKSDWELCPLASKAPTSASYKNREYALPPHKWVSRANGYLLLDEHGKTLGRVEPYATAYRVFSGEKEFAMQETLTWAKAVVLLETFHPGSIGEDAFY